MTFLRWLLDLLWVRDLPPDIKVPPDDGQRGPVYPIDGCPDTGSARHYDNARIEAFVSRMEAEADMDE